MCPTRTQDPGQYISTGQHPHGSPMAALLQNSDPLAPTLRNNVPHCVNIVTLSGSSWGGGVPQRCENNVHMHFQNHPSSGSSAAVAQKQCSTVRKHCPPAKILCGSRVPQHCENNAPHCENNVPLSEASAEAESHNLVKTMPQCHIICGS